MKEIAKQIQKARILLNDHNIPNKWFKDEHTKEANEHLSKIDDKLSEIISSIMIEEGLSIQDIFS